jgi:hypothetical protein
MNIAGRDSEPILVILVPVLRVQGGDGQIDPQDSSDAGRLGPTPGETRKLEASPVFRQG